MSKISLIFYNFQFPVPFSMAAVQVSTIQSGYWKLQTSNTLPLSFLKPATSRIFFTGKDALGKRGLESFWEPAPQRKLLGAGHMEHTPGRRKFQGLNIRAAKRTVSDRSFLMSSTLVAKAEDEDKVVELCRSIIQWGQQKQKDKSSGIQQFECYVDLFDKHTYHFMERYSGFQHITNIRALPEHVKFMNDVRPLLTCPVAFAVYEYWNGQIGPMRNPIGPKGEGGLDDATGQAGIGGGVSHKQQSKLMQQVDVGEKKDRGAWSLQKVLQKRARAANEEESEKSGNPDESGHWNFKTIFAQNKK
eukprot:Gb_15077 [translate_table: standard]